MSSRATASSLRPRSSPYSQQALAYHESGLGAPLPLPRRRKHPPPAGWTGRRGAWPDRARVIHWMSLTSAGNIGLRLPAGLLGLDVDAYGSKRGVMTLRRLEQECGDLPATARSSSRPDSVSGIRLFKVPAELAWPSEVQAVQPDGRITSDVEVVDLVHRFMVVWPSIHPEGRLYRWYSGIGTVLQRLPLLSEIADLPPAWVQLLRRQQPEPELNPRPGASAGREQDPGAGLLAAKTQRQQSTTYSRRTLNAVRRELLKAPQGGRNSALNRAAFRLGQLVAEGQLDEAEVRGVLLADGLRLGLPSQEISPTISSGLAAGLKSRRGRGG